MRLLLVASLVLAALVALPAAGGAAVELVPCPAKEGVRCGAVRVPLDRSGALPGEIPLHVELRRAEGRPRGTVLVLPGGPGQGSSTILAGYALDWLAGLFDGYDVLLVDMRGTGRSGLLQCDWPPVGVPGRDVAPAVAACAERLGPARARFTTREAVEDVEAVRAALGIERLALFGTSYGTILAQAYARAHPDRVERLLLDSAAAVEWDVAGAATLQAARRVLGEICAAVHCPPGTGGLRTRAIRVANRLGELGELVTTIGPDGRREPVGVAGGSVVDLLVASDVNPALRALLPAAVALADRGDLRGLARLTRLLLETPRGPSSRFSLALFTTLLCEEGAFPWPRGEVSAGRADALAAAAAAVPLEQLGPFDRWAASRHVLQVAAYCLGWPQAPEPPALLGHALPDVPVLVVQGRLDARTPLEVARAIAALAPQGRVVAVAGTGHSVLSPAEPCVEDAVKAWLAGRVPPSACPGAGSWLPAIGAPPRTLGELPARGTLPPTVARTVAAVRLTLADAALAAVASLLQGRRTPLGGPVAGTLRPGWGTVVLERYAVVPGVEVSGRLDLLGAELAGRVLVTGPAAARGTLVVSPGEATGRLGAVRVG